MDITGMSADEKLQKYNDFNAEPADLGGIEYIPNAMADKPTEPVTDIKTPSISTPNYASIFNTYKAAKKVETFDPMTAQPLEAINATKGQAFNIKRASLGANLKGDKAEVVKSIDALKIDADDKYFLKVLANRESTFDRNATVTDKKGRTYEGLYQFGKGALGAVGMTRDEYMGDINKQHLAALKYGEQNIKGLEKYIGQTVLGVKVTKAGMMAAAHLGGRGGLEALLKGQQRKDMFGTSTLNYLKMFEH